MDDPDVWTRLLAGAGEESAAQPQRIASLCVELLGISGAGISLVTAVGNRGVVCATDDLSARIEDLQFTLGEGPCVDAVHTGSPVLVPDLLQPGDVAVDRWPGFMEGAGTAGVHAIFAFPLRIGAISVGALDLYRDLPGPLSPKSLRGALLASDSAALALLHLDAGSNHDGATTGRPESTTYDPRVHQATGMVQVQMGTSTEEAFLMLRARAFALDRSLNDVAADVVARRLRFSSEDR